MNNTGNYWYSLMNVMPPYDVLVETKGGCENPEKIVKDRFSSYVGDWTIQAGDPTHWRRIGADIKRNIGLFFGSFNPIHNGHFIMAEQVYNSVSLDEIIFVPSPHNPLKNIEDLAPFEDRLNMLVLSSDNYPFISVSDIEKNMPTPSYTVDTLQKIQDKYRNDNLSLIMGLDAFNDIDKWKNYQEVLKYRILVVKRPCEEKIKHGGHVLFLNNIVVDISSSFIREQIRQNKSVISLLPNEAYKHIKEKGLYGFQN